MADFDYTEQHMALGGNALAQLHDFARQQLEAQAEVSRLEQELKLAKAKLSHITERLFPDFMSDLGLQSYATPDGFSVSIVSKIRASISENNEEEAFQWLIDNGHESIIKNKVTVQLPACSPELPGVVVDKIKEQVPDAPILIKKSVHPSTLCAFLAEQVSDGVDIPLRLFGAFQQRFTKVSRED